jgi:hypothetical protein
MKGGFYAPKDNLWTVFFYLKLEQYAHYWGIKKGSDDWYDYFDLAAAYTGKITADSMEDAELAKKIPIVFRTVNCRTEGLSPLFSLIRLIRENGNGSGIPGTTLPPQILRRFSTLCS